MSLKSKLDHSPSRAFASGSITEVVDILALYREDMIP